MFVWSSQQIDRLEALAQRYLGTPWVENSVEPTVGFDCWGWTWFVYAQCGLALPRNLWMAKPLFQSVDLPGQPGDVLHSWSPSAPREHLGVKLRGLRMVDCNASTPGLAIHDLTRRPWPRALKGAWRLREDWRDRLAQEGQVCA